MATPTPETKTTLHVACERCQHWRAVNLLRPASGNPACTCGESARYLIHTGAADSCGEFTRKT